MFLSVQAKDNRFKAVRRQMADQGIDALIARGSSAVRGDGAAFRFLTDFPNINIPLVLIFSKDPDQQPILLVESRFQAMRAAKDSWAGAAKAIKDALPHLKPGNKVSQAMRVMEESVKGSGTRLYSRVWSHRRHRYGRRPAFAAKRNRDRARHGLHRTPLADSG
jgi:hypothetical protein